MLELDQPLNLDFVIPAADPLGREEVVGKLRFLPAHCELHWRLGENVFRGGKGSHQIITIPYGQIDDVQLTKKWFRSTIISFHVSDPSLVKEIPNVLMGNISFEISRQSKKELKSLCDFIDFKKSLFVFEQNDAYLKQLKNQ